MTKRSMSIPTVQIPLVRKERERLAKRQEILSAARRVFAQKGYTNATLDEIAERAEFAKGTLYNYFESKEELFDEMVGGMLDDMKAIAEHAIAEGGTVREQFHHYACHIIDYYKANEDVVRVLMREMDRMQLEEEQAHLSEVYSHMRALSGLLAAVLKGEMAKKNIIKEDPQSLAQVFIAMIHDRVLRRLVEGKSLQAFDTQKESAFMVRLFFEGATLR